MTDNGTAINRPGNLSLEGNLAENWRRFKQNLTIYLDASGKTSESEATKVAILLNIAGEDAIELFNTFTFTDEEDKKKLDPVIAQFENYCNPRKNIVFERYKFWQCVQESSETTDQFVTRLKTMVKPCEYASPEEMVRDKLVFGIKDNAVKERLLREDNLTLKKASDIARTSEISKQQIHAMKSTSNAYDVKEEYKTPGVNSVQRTQFNKKQKTKKSRSNQSTCSFCGTKHAPKKCPAYRVTCRYCSKIGHYDTVCRQKYFTQKKNVHAVEQDEDQSESEDSEDTVYREVNDLNTLDSSKEIDDVKTSDNKDEWRVTVKICGKDATYKIDTGAQCNAMSEAAFNALKICDVKSVSTKTILKLFNNQKIRPKCKIFVPCKHNGIVKTIEIFIVKEKVPSVLGLATCIDLNLIKKVDIVDTKKMDQIFSLIVLKESKIVILMFLKALVLSKELYTKFNLTPM